jgi:hypothetical protein
MVINYSLRGVGLVVQDVYQSMPLGYKRAAVHIALDLLFEGYKFLPSESRACVIRLRR